MNEAAFLAALDALLSRKADADTRANRPLLTGDYSDSIFETDEHFWSLCRGQRYAYPLNVEQRKLSAIDRTASMLSGPFYTSELFPWLETNGYSWEPIVQIDLDFAGQVAGEVIGSGLVQVWKKANTNLSQDADNFECRHVPRDQISQAKLAALPEGLCCEPKAAHAWRVKEEANPPWFSDGIQILGVAKPELSLNSLFEDLLQNDVIEREDEYEAGMGDEANFLIGEFSGRSKRDGDYLLGNFHPIQFGPYLAPLLVNLDTEHFFWGDEGSAQLFYTKGTGDGGCWFEWSC